MSLEIWWLDVFAHEAWPKNPNRPAPPHGAIEVVRKSEYDRVIDLLRQHGLDLDQGASNEKECIGPERGDRVNAG
jgi:hypothetical protein